MNVFTSLFDALDTTLDSYVNAAVVAATGYVSGPIAVLGTISFITMGLVLLRGMSEIPLAKFVQTSGLLALVFALAGSAATTTPISRTICGPSRTSSLGPLPWLPREATTRPSVACWTTSAIAP